MNNLLLFFPPSADHLPDLLGLDPNLQLCRRHHQDGLFSTILPHHDAQKDAAVGSNRHRHRGSLEHVRTATPEARRSGFADQDLTNFSSQIFMGIFICVPVSGFWDPRPDMRCLPELTTCTCCATTKRLTIARS